MPTLLATEATPGRQVCGPVGISSGQNRHRDCNRDRVSVLIPRGGQAKRTPSTASPATGYSRVDPWEWVRERAASGESAARRRLFMRNSGHMRLASVSSAPSSSNVPTLSSPVGPGQAFASFRVKSGVTTAVSPSVNPKTCFLQRSTLCPGVLDIDSDW